ncbi:MAG: carbohydrate ABC transporter permease, partial [Pseudomonadota bacterium]
MATARALEPPFHIKFANGAFIIFWLLLAAFPLFWILIMSFKLPVDALASNPLTVIFGPTTQTDVGGLGLVDLLLGVVFFIVCYRLVENHTGKLASALSVMGQAWLGWILAATITLVLLLIVATVFLPATSRTVDWILGGIPGLGWLATPFIGTTVQHYIAVWYDNEFYRNFINSMIVTGGVVTISLTVGTLAGYALARTGSNLAFWLLIIALIFRALPHSVLVTGYLPPFIQSREILMPLWQSPFIGWFFQLFSAEPPTLYGQ